MRNDMRAVEKIRKLQTELNAIVAERTDEVEGALTALIAGQHVLLLGPPGTAKSMLADMICKAIDGGEYFQWLLTKHSTPEELFGPLSLRALKEDTYKRNVSNKLPEAHIVFLDEIFKSNSAILNSLLTAINERKFHNNGKPIDLPLITVFGASNELPQGEELGALYDRFPLRFWVDAISDDSNFSDLLTGRIGSGEPTVSLTLAEIKQMQAEAAKLPLSPKVVKSIVTLRHQLRKRGITVSDRRWKTAVRLMQALAYLRGEEEVGSEEFDILANVLWDEPEQRKDVRKALEKFADPITVQVAKYKDGADEVFALCKDNDWELDAIMEGHRTLKAMKTRIESDIESGPGVKAVSLLAEALDKVNAHLREVATHAGLQ